MNTLSPPATPKKALRNGLAAALSPSSQTTPDASEIDQSLYNEVIAQLTGGKPHIAAQAAQQLEEARTPPLTIPPLIALEAEKCRRSFRKFVEAAWHVIEPASPFIAGWHIDAVCEHLQAVTELKIRDLIVSIPPRHCKPVYEEMLVSTQSGARVPLKEIQVGDMVKTHKGRYRKVTAVHIQGDLPTRTIVTHGNRQLITALDHPFLTADGWVECKDLKVGQKLAAIIPQEKTVYNDATEEEARFAGYLIGDGSVKRGQWVLTCYDDAQGQDFIHCAESIGFKISLPESSKGTRYSVLKGRGAKEIVWRYKESIHGKGSWDKTVPDWVFRSSDKVVANFIGAYFACDGTLTRKGKARRDAALQFCSVSKELLEGVRSLLIRLGIRSRIRNRYNKKLDSYHFTLDISSQDDYTKFVQRIPVYGVKAQELKNWALPRANFDFHIVPDEIVEIIDSGVKPCRCLTVDQDSSFCIDDIAVHNSTLLAVLWPAWVWLTNPGDRWLFFSYAHALSKRDSRRCRALIQSQWYQERWGSTFSLAKDSNTMLRFDNNHMGFRFATSVNGMLTGEGGDYLIGDDLNNMKEVHSAVKRENVCTFWDEVVSSRVNNPQTGRRVVIAQRGHSKDLIGHILDNDKGTGDWCNLLLPAEYDPKLKCVTSIGWEDPRTKEGELLWPQRFGPKELRKLKKDLGSYAYAAQYQQRPTPEDGGVFDPAWWCYYFPSQLPPHTEWTDSCISIDMSFGAVNASASYVVAQAWCRVGAKFYLIDQIRGQWEYVKSKQMIRAFCAKHHHIFAILVENKANGPAIMDDLQHGENGIPGIFGIEPNGTKEARARSVSPMVEARNVHLPQLMPWCEEWLGDLLLELGTFPKASNDDQVDALSQALERLREGFAFGVSVNDDEDEDYEGQNAENMDPEARRLSEIEATEKRLKLEAQIQEQIQSQNKIRRKVAVKAVEETPEQTANKKTPAKLNKAKEAELNSQVLAFLDWATKAA